MPSLVGQQDRVASGRSRCVLLCSIFRFLLTSTKHRYMDEVDPYFAHPVRKQIKSTTIICAWRQISTVVWQTIFCAAFSTSICLQYLPLRSFFTQYLSDLSGRQIFEHLFHPEFVCQTNIFAQNFHPAFVRITHICAAFLPSSCQAGKYLVTSSASTCLHKYQYIFCTGCEILACLAWHNSL